LSTASSATTPSREKLSSTDPLRISSRFLALTVCRVFSIRGMCSVTKSLPLRISSTEAARFTCDGRLQAPSTVMCGS
jgi:hypothetical protein